MTTLHWRYDEYVWKVRNANTHFTIWEDDSFVVDFRKFQPSIFFRKRGFPSLKKAKAFAQEVANGVHDAAIAASQERRKAHEKL